MMSDGGGPDGGNRGPDGGNPGPDGGNPGPDGGNPGPDGGNIKPPISPSFTCPSPSKAAETISHLPAGSRLFFKTKKNSLEDLGKKTFRACAECEYQVILPNNRNG